MRSQLWAFSQDRCVDVRNAVAALGYQLDCVREEFQARNAGPSRIAIGKVCADVSKRCSPQQRITDRVSQHVRIRMPKQALLKGNLHSAQYELPPLAQPADDVAW